MRVVLQILAFMVSVLMLSSVMDWGLSWVPEWVRGALNLMFLTLFAWCVVTGRFHFGRRAT